MVKRCLRTKWLRGAQRRVDNRTLAYYVEKAGLPWTTIRKVLPHVAAALKVPYGYDTPRSLVVHECCAVLRKRGLDVPADYQPPWERYPNRY